MRFMTRSLLGLAILALTLALLMTAAGNVWRAAEERAAEQGGSRGGAERVYAAAVKTMTLGSAEPVIRTFGEVASWRTLELRAASSGRIVSLSDRFREGAFVPANTVLVVVDPADAQTALDLAEAELSEAKSELRDAKTGLELAILEQEAAVEQIQMQQLILDRQSDLKDRGVGSETAVENAMMSLTSARQTELARRQSVATAESRISRAEIGLSRAAINREEALRRLRDTEIVAPFDGLLIDADAGEGRLLGANERIGLLIDPAALEVSFRVSNSQFSRLIDARGNVRPVEVKVTLDLGGAEVTASATLVRTAAEVGEGQTGRLAFATIDPATAGLLRQGDFVSVEIAEPRLENVAVIPSTAATSSGGMLLLGEDDRLEAAEVTILRRQDATLIVTDVPEGREFVTKLAPHLGAGIKVKPSREGTGFEEREMVRLDPARKAELIAAIEGNTRMPSQVRDRLLGQLQAEEIPAEVVARIESRIGGGQGSGGQGAREGADGPTIPLDAERRAKLVAFVEGNQRMPADAKTRILAQLKEDAVPEALVERLESRMGG